MFSILRLNLKAAISRCSKRHYVRLPSVYDIKDPIKILKHSLLDGRLPNILPCPRECDVLIIGGSVVGSSIAYFLKEQQNKLNVVVIEPDCTYSKASALLSVGGMRQQFSCQENIEMSQFGFEFLRRSKDLLAVREEPPPDVQFNHAGYLILAGKDDAEDLMKNYQLQRQCGVVCSLLSPDMLKKKYPWISSEGIEVASVGLQGEGWLDPAALLAGFKGKNRSYEVPYIDGRVIGFEHSTVRQENGQSTKRVDMTLVELANGDVQPVKSAFLINAAGAWAGEVALMAGIGDGSIDPICAVPLPVEPRKRFVFSFHCSEGPGLDCGLVTDCSQGSVYFRREGLSNNYVCGISPPAEMEPDHSNLDDIDYELFEEIIWPRLAHRVPAFEGLKLKSAWAGYYDYNFVDQNLIIGNHPYFTNFFFSNGSTGHGLQHSPAMGRAISEIINYQEYRTVNLDRFSFHRFTDEDSIPSEMNIF